MIEDEKNLNLLAIFHYIVAGLTALFSCIPLVHVAIGLAIVSGKFDGKNPPPQMMGWILIIVGGIIILCGWALAVAILMAGRKLKARTSRTYCIVVAALECMMMPFGTILGVLTIIVLMKDSVKAIFAAGNRLGAPGHPLRGSPVSQP